MKNRVLFRTFTMLYTYHLYLVSKHFCHPKRKLYPLSNLSLNLSLPAALGSSSLHSVFLDLSILDTSHKLNHTICATLCLAVFAEHVFEVIHIVAGISTSFLLVAECCSITPQCVYPFICSWTCGLFPPFGCCE